MAKGLLRGWPLPPPSQHLTPIHSWPCPLQTSRPAICPSSKADLHEGQSPSAQLHLHSGASSTAGKQRLSPPPSGPGSYLEDRASTVLVVSRLLVSPVYRAWNEKDLVTSTAPCLMCAGPWEQAGAGWGGQQRPSGGLPGGPQRISAAKLVVTPHSEDKGQPTQPEVDQGRGLLFQSRTSVPGRVLRACRC